MLAYILVSAGVLYTTRVISLSIIKKRIESIGYINENSFSHDENKSLGKKILGAISYFIPVINNIFSLIYIACLVYTMDDKRLEELCKKGASFYRADYAKVCIEYEKKNYNLEAMRDAMKIEGADEECINSMSKEINK